MARMFDILIQLTLLFSSNTYFQICPNLPKTRSGKIMRRILTKLAAGEKEGFGDVSTCSDPSIVETLMPLVDAVI